MARTHYTRRRNGRVEHVRFNEIKPHPKVAQSPGSASWKQRHPKLKTAISVGTPLAIGVGLGAVKMAMDQRAAVGPHGKFGSTIVENAIMATSHLGPNAGLHYTHSAQSALKTGNRIRAGVFFAGPIAGRVAVAQHKKRRAKRGK